MASHGVRRTGSAAIDLAYVACGRLDVFWEFGLKPWDMAAGTLLVTEAGGAVSRYARRGRTASPRRSTCWPTTAHCTSRCSRSSARSSAASSASRFRRFPSRPPERVERTVHAETRGREGTRGETGAQVCCVFCADLDLCVSAMSSYLRLLASQRFRSHAPNDARPRTRTPRSPMKPQPPRAYTLPLCASAAASSPC